MSTLHYSFSPLENLLETLGKNAEKWGFPKIYFENLFWKSKIVENQAKNRNKQIKNETIKQK